MQNKTAKTQKKSTKNTAQTGKSTKQTAQKNSNINQKTQDKRKTNETKQPAKTKGTKPSRSSRRKDDAASNTRASTKNVRITFLGGINEIGKNLTLFEYNGEMIILDCGMTFPDADMPGIDYVLPDFSFIERNAERIRAVFITHGHEDHIGGLPYLMKIVKAPVYASALTRGLIEGKLKEHRLLSSTKLKTIKPGEITQAGAFSVEAIHVNHSIPDSMGFAIKTPAGTIVHTGDFKIDNTPIDGGVIDLSRFASLGNEGVLALMQDSTNAEKAGYTPSEKEVGKTLEQLFARAGKKRILVASFASNIHRIQQIVDASVKMKRKIFLSGRSLENVTSVSRELGFLNVPDGILVSIENLKNYRDEDIVLITTGSQGEPMSALTRMATGEHKKVSIGCNDYVIISATPIPGNEKTVANTINELMKLGAEVIYEKSLGIHVSGHAAQEELKLIMNLVKPKFFIPVHGEQKHMRRHAELAQSIGIQPKNIHVPELGEVIEVGENGIKTALHVPAGRIFVDGSGVGDVGSAVLRDRKKLSTDGVVLISAVSDAYTGGLMLPVEIQTKGFVFTDNANELSSYISDVCEDVFDRYRRGVDMDVNALKQRLKDSVAKVIFDRTKRTPVIIVSVFAV